MSGLETLMFESWYMAAQRADRVRFVRSGEIDFFSRKQARRPTDDEGSLYELCVGIMLSGVSFSGW